MKKCNCCQQEKTLNNFEPERAVCKSCRNKQRQIRPKKYYDPTLTEKICCKCNILKQRCEFNLDSSRIGGLHVYCNQCRSYHNENNYKNNSEQIKQKCNEYYQKIRKTDEYRKKANQRAKVRRKTDPKFLLKRRLRARLYSALKSKGWNKTNKFAQYIGCSQEELKQHIENQFTVGMSWDNTSEWHIDHIIPLDSAHTEEEMYKLCHYTNLQPLWALDNIKKGTKSFQGYP